MGCDCMDEEDVCGRYMCLLFTSAASASLSMLLMLPVRPHSPYRIHWYPHHQLSICSFFIQPQLSHRCVPTVRSAGDC